MLFSRDAQPQNLPVLPGVSSVAVAPSRLAKLDYGNLGSVP